MEYNTSGSQQIVMVVARVHSSMECIAAPFSGQFNSVSACAQRTSIAILEILNHLCMYSEIYLTPSGVVVDGDAICLRKSVFFPLRCASRHVPRAVIWSLRRNAKRIKYQDSVLCAACSTGFSITSWTPNMCGPKSWPDHLLNVLAFKTIMLMMLHYGNIR